MPINSQECQVTVIGAGPYGLSAHAFLKAAGIESRVFGEPMAFWANQMPGGMFLRSSWGASHIADPKGAMTLDAYRTQTGNGWGSPIPLDRFVSYGRWFQSNLAPEVDQRKVETINCAGKGFELRLADGETVISRRVVIAVGIAQFAFRPQEFDALPKEYASHTSDHKDLSQFKGKRLCVIGGGQSALESAAILHDIGVDVEVMARQNRLNWVGRHSWLHHLGPISKMLYSSRDVGPAGLSRLVSAPRIFQRFPRGFQDRASYRAIRPAGSEWLQPRLINVPIELGCRVTSAQINGNKVRLTLSGGQERLFDGVLLGTGFRVDVTRYKFFSEDLKRRLSTAKGSPILSCGLESSIPGLHFLGRPAAWSYGPLLCFVSGTEFASNELLRVFRSTRQ